MSGETHHLFIEMRSGRPVVMMASKAEELANKIRALLLIYPREENQQKLQVLLEQIAQIEKLPPDAAQVNEGLERVAGELEGFQKEGQRAYGMLKNGERLTEAKAQELLQRISLKDTSAVADLAGAERETAPLGRGEWGIGQRSGQIFVIPGGGTNVDFRKSLGQGDGVTALAHSHPYETEVTGYRRPGGYGTWLSPRGLKEDVPLASILENSAASGSNRGLILPTLNDLHVATLVPKHTVYTPYRLVNVSGSWVVSAEFASIESAGSQLIFEIRGAEREKPSEEKPGRLKATLTVRSGTTSVVESRPICGSVDSVQGETPVRFETPE